MLTKLTCFSDSLDAIPLFLLTPDSLALFLTTQNTFSQTWLTSNAFRAEAKQICLVPNEQGQLAFVCIGITHTIDLYALGDCPFNLPEGCYKIATVLNTSDLSLLSLGWALGAYQFTRYKKATRTAAQFVLPGTVDQTRLTHELEAIYWARDLINTPACDMMPEHLSAQAQCLARRFKGHFFEIIGDDLLTQNYPMIHAVGRASIHAPRLIDLRFGDHAWPKVTLVGKGVCFDSGGLDIKPASGMLHMKKDMGGAAHVLGLAQLILNQQLKIRLRVLIPAVENAIGGNAFRPGDILTSRHGLTIEVGDTDAEGRLVLADALSEACTENPELLIDFATLTGAARVAVGTDIAAFFSPDENLSAELQQAADSLQDPCWRLPLFAAYQSMFTSTIADLNSVSHGGYAGAITAALFLQAFVPKAITWLHVDMMAFNLSAAPGKPIGGEAMAIRALFYVIKERFR